MYMTVHDNHNEWFPECPMLFYEQINKKVAEWSSVQPIVHDMCPNSCMAYTGPFTQLDNCAKCELSHWDPFRFENSQGKVKVAAQHFYMIPLEPQLQALWHSPISASHMNYCRTRTAHIYIQLHNFLRNTVFGSLNVKLYNLLCRLSHMTIMSNRLIGIFLFGRK